MSNERSFKGIWIPKEIWLDKNLTLQEKVFLVEITSLDNDDGCFASNAYFSEFFGLTKQRVSQVINGLIDKKLLTVKLYYKTGTKLVEKRVLKVSSIFDRGIKESKEGYQENFQGYQEKFKDNNTVNNTKRKTLRRKRRRKPTGKETEPKNKPKTIKEQSEIFFQTYGKALRAHGRKPDQTKFEVEKKFRTLNDAERETIPKYLSQYVADKKRYILGMGRFFNSKVFSQWEEEYNLSPAVEEDESLVQRMRREAREKS